MNSCHRRFAIRLLGLLALSVATLLPGPARGAEDQPVRVYLLVGQSNMQGKGPVEGGDTNSLRHVVEHDPDGDYRGLVTEDGKWVEREDVWIYLDQAPNPPKHGGLAPGYGSSGGQVGPELGFGHAIGDTTDAQVLLIKACWGGKSLGHNFLPPSVGNYPAPLVPSDPGFYYHEILRIVDEVTGNIATLFPDYRGQGVEIAGLGFHQGWNDQYGGLDATYETNLAAFIRDLRSVEHGIGVPGLPVVIATSGMIEGESPIKQGQLAMADTGKYPEFAGNVAVVDTDQPYGPDRMEFKFYTEKSPDKVGYHWNNHARSYVNIGRAMAAEMRRLDRPRLPARLVARGCADGVQLNWQLGSETPTAIEILRNGESLGAELAPARTTHLDTTALPGANRYELRLDLPASGRHVLRARCDTSVATLTAFRSMEGVMLGWEAGGKYGGFRLTRDGQVIADRLAPDTRSFEDREAPPGGTVTYALEPTTGEVTPATLAVNLGPPDPGGALVYEPFDYPGTPGEPRSLIGQGGAHGTRGTYVYLSEKPDREPAVETGGLVFGSLPVTGNRGSTHRWSKGGYIELDDSLKNAGLLEDGATLWISYVFLCGEGPSHRQGGGIVTLRSADMTEGVGFKATGRQYETVVVLDGELMPRRITGTRPRTPTLVVGRIVWGAGGAEDSFVPFHVGPDLALPEKEGRASVPFNIDQGRLSRLVLEGEGQFDEIRVGPTFESVVGGGGD